jgi:hypothetical protein
MDYFNLLDYGAWLAAGALLLWMVADAIRVSRDFPEDLLLSSEEGHDEFLPENR